MDIVRFALICPMSLDWALKANDLLIRSMEANQLHARLSIHAVSGSNDGVGVVDDGPADVVPTEEGVVLLQGADVVVVTVRGNFTTNNELIHLRLTQSHCTSSPLSTSSLLSSSSPSSSSSY